MARIDPADRLQVDGPDPRWFVSVPFISLSWVPTRHADPPSVLGKEFASVTWKYTMGGPVNQRKNANPFTSFIFHLSFP